MKAKLPKLFKRPKIVFSILIVLILIIGGICGYFYLTSNASPIPEKIVKQLTFSPFIIPNGTNGYTTTSYKFQTVENNLQVLSYSIHLNGNTVSMSEQPQPSEFVEISGYQDQFLSNVAEQYDTVQTSNGVIYLGHLARQNNKQLGVMLESGLLVLMSPSRALNSTQWRMLGEQFVLQKI
jgi:predicted restriction endonuclease